MRKNKVEIKLELDSHYNMLKNVVVESLQSITLEEITELKNLYKDSSTNNHSRDHYFNLVTDKYKAKLWILSTQYNVTVSIKKYIFYQTHNLLLQLYKKHEQLTINAVK